MAGERPPSRRTRLAGPFVLSLLARMWPAARCADVSTTFVGAAWRVSLDGGGYMLLADYLDLLRSESLAVQEATRRGKVVG
jgi:hypothetical protein